MPEIDFTVFFPTRGRPHLLNGFIDSLIRNTKDISKVELLLWVDEDDSLTKEYYDAYLSKLPFVKVFFKARPESLNAAINFLAAEAKGRFLVNVNDDALFQTYGWDEIALRKLDQYKSENSIKDDILFGRTECNSVDRDRSKGYCSFPIISKQAVETIGLFMYPAMVGLGGDSSIYRVYEAIGRIVDLSEIVYDHQGHSSVERIINCDAVAAEMRQKSWGTPVDPFTYPIEREVELLKQKIKELN